MAEQGSALDTSPDVYKVAVLVTWASSCYSMDFRCKSVEKAINMVLFIVGNTDAVAFGCSLQYAGMLLEFGDASKTKFREEFEPYARDILNWESM